MAELSVWSRLVLAVLATWRITHLLAREDGPADLIARFRERLGSGFLGSLMDCFHCLSLWVAAPMAFFVAGRPLDLLLAWLGLSGGACLLERVVPPSVEIRPVPPNSKGDGADGMLWSETSGDEKSPAGDKRATHGPTHH